MDSVRVLLVDDERDIVDTVKYSLELRGFDVDVCYDGENAVKKARSGRYALVLLDVMLPGKNGYEVSRLLKDDMARGDVPPFKIMLITARKQAGAFDVVRKRGAQARPRDPRGVRLDVVQGGRLSLQAF